MPDTRPVPEPQYKDLNLEPYKFRDEVIDKDYAHNLVMRSFDDCERWRAQNMEPRWNKHDKLYYGWVRQRYWKGTNQKRSSLPIRLVLDHLESAFPELVMSLFVEDPDWFEVLPDIGTTVQEAREIQQRLSYVLDQQGDEYGKTAMVELKRALRSFCHYANGYIELGYDMMKRRPFVQWLDIRDVYLPPNTGNWVDDAPYWIKRTWMSVQELDDLRNLPGMNIPSRPQLAYLAENKPTRVADQEKDALSGLLNRQINFAERNSDPSQQEIEVLVFQSKDRIIWDLNGKWVAYNEPNPWQFFSLCGASFSLVLGQQGGEAIPDFLEFEQKLQQSINNGGLDELALNLDPPRNALPSALAHPSKLHIHPGALFKSTTPDKDLLPQPVGNVTRDAFIFIEESNRRAQKRTGISEVVQSGLPTPSNANRTAAGLQGQSAAASRRLFTAIGNFEDYLLVPMLIKMKKMVAMYEADLPQVAGKDGNGNGIALPGKSMGKASAIKVKASSKMQGRSRFAAALQTMLQYLFNPSLVAMATKQGTTLDFGEVDNFVNEAIGTARRYQFFRKATPEELQVMNQPDPNTQAQIQSKQQDAQVRLQLGQMKAQADIEGEKIKAEADMQVQAEKVAVEVIKLLQADKNLLAGLMDKEEGEGEKDGKSGSAGKAKQPKKPAA